jgi:rhodanese-related sulfurtransferase
VIFRQLIHDDLGCASYLLGDEKAGVAAGVERGRAEWAAGHIPGSVSIPWHELRERPQDVDLDGPIAVLCSSGQRAGAAASLLQHHGARRVLHVVDGGVAAWGRLGHPVESYVGRGSRYPPPLEGK